MNASGGQPKYWAFISYSHADAKWGQWLHKKLETFPVPRALVGKETERGYKVPKRLMPIFRDREELPGSATLKDNIQEALEQSRYLVVICSPRSAASIWVNEEVLTFKAMGRSDRVLCLIVDGEPNATDKPGSGLLECFPPAVRHAVNADRSLCQQREEPIAADARPGKDGKVDSLIKLASGLLGVGFDDLKQRDARRRRRRKALYAMAAMAFAALLAWGAWEFKAQRVRLQNAASSIADFREAAATFDGGDSGLGMAYLARALKKDPSNRLAAQRLFYELTYKNWVRSIREIASGQGLVISSAFSPDAGSLAFIIGDPRALIVVDTKTGKTISKLNATDNWQPEFVSFCANDVIAVRARSPAVASVPNSVTIHESASGAILKEFRLDGFAANCVASAEDGDTILVGWGRTSSGTYWSPTELSLMSPEQSGDADSSEMRALSGAVQLWQRALGTEDILQRETDWPVICASLHPDTDRVYLGGLKDDFAGCLQAFTISNLSAASDPVGLPAFPQDLQVSEDGKELAAACGDAVARVFRADADSSPNLLATIESRGGQRMLLLRGGFLGIADAAGDAQLNTTRGRPVLTPWALGTQNAGLALDSELNFSLVSWAGITPQHRGGRVILRQLIDHKQRLLRSPLEPALWWPSASICSAAVAERCDKLYILKTEPGSDDFTWNLLLAPLSNRAAEAEELPLKLVLAGSVTPSPSGELFACLADKEDGTKSQELAIIVFDAVSRKEKAWQTAPKGSAELLYSACGTTIACFSQDAVVFFDDKVQELGRLAIEGEIYRNEHGKPIIVTSKSDKVSPRTSLLGFVRRSVHDTQDYELVIIDVLSRAQIAAHKLPSKPKGLAMSSKAGCFVLSWEDGESLKCSVFSLKTGDVVKVLDDSQHPAAFSPDGRRFLATKLKAPLLYCTEKWKVITELDGHSRYISSYDFDPINKHLATGSLDGTVQLWSQKDGTAAGEQILPIDIISQSTPKYVAKLRFNADGSQLLAGFVEYDKDADAVNFRGSFGVWDVKEQLAVVPEHPAPFFDDAWFIGDGRSVALVTGDGGFRFISFFDASFLDQEVEASIARLAQEVSGYTTEDQIKKRSDLVDIERVLGSDRSTSMSGEKGESAKWLDWFLSDPLERTVSPFSALPASEYRRTLTTGLGTQRFLLKAFALDPWDDLNLANLALLTNDKQASDAMWKAVSKTSPDNKEIHFRRAVRYFEDSYYLDDEQERFRAAKNLSRIVTEILQTDLDWQPREQGKTRNLAVSIDNSGLLTLVSHSGSSDYAKTAAYLEMDTRIKLQNKDPKTWNVAEYTDGLIEHMHKYAGEKSTATLISCAADLRQAFWLDQDGHSWGKIMFTRWALHSPQSAANAVVQDATDLSRLNLQYALPLWLFAYECFQLARLEANKEQLSACEKSQALLAALFAKWLLEERSDGAQAEIFARDSLSLRQKADSPAWMLASSKLLVGASLLQQNRDKDAEPFVVSSAESLLAEKNELPVTALPRLTEAVNRAALLYEKKGDQKLASYWRSESEKLSADPRFASTE
jgi:WD40 repeat protein